MKSDKMNRLLSHTLIFKISPINAFITWEVLNLGCKENLRWHKKHHDKSLDRGKNCCREAKGK